MKFEEWGAFFAKHGPQVGDPMPAPTLVNEAGEARPLSELWEDRPTVLVSASLTCPVARERIPDLAARIDGLGDRIGRGVLYTKEAHPKIDKAPHAEGEWLTDANVREGILHRQPTDIEERLALAALLIDGWTRGFAHYIDGMDDGLYELFGTAPCMGLLIDAEGVIRVKQGWLEPDAMAAALSEHLAG